MTLFCTLSYPKYAMKLYFASLIFFISLTAQSQTWQDVGGGTNNSSHGLLVWNGQLINLGSFNNPCNRVAAWDGTSWSCLGGGVGIVARAGCVWNGNLVVVGDFWNNFQPCPGCNGVAMWDGTQWTAFDQGFNNDVLTCTVYNGDLIIGGDFTQANGVPINRVARWNTTTNTFESMGAATDMDNDVRCMTVFDGELWVGGDFNNVGGNPPSDGVVKWDESTQTWVGGNSGVDLVGGVNETVRVLYVNPNDGNLYMGGEFPELIDGDFGVTDYDMSGIAMYDGSNWYSLGTGLNEYCRAIHEYNGNLIVGGYFTTAGGVSCNKIAKWNGSTWSPMGLGFDGSGIDEYVKSATTWNGTFFAGGAYTQAEGGPMNYIAQWYEAPTTPPVAAFNASTTSTCEGECINFVDISTNGPTSWTWSFPGSSTPSSSIQNPSNICYPTAGNYVAELTACNGSGCNTSLVNITIGTVPSVIVNDVSICDGESTMLVATPSSSGGDYYWPSTGETTSSISVSPTTTTSYSVEYTLNGCVSALETAQVTVNPTPTISVNDEIICEGQSVVLTASPSISGGSYDWITTGESTSSINVAPATSTVYEVDYSLNGCTSPTAFSSVFVNPSYNLTENYSVCEGTIVTYPDGTSETINSPTTHLSNLLTSNGCDSIISTSVGVYQNYADSYSVDLCAGSNYTYPDGTTSTNVTTNESHISNLQTTNGCDSIIAVQLNIISAYNTSESYSLCSGDNFTYPDGTSVTNLQVGETHVSNLISMNGCDSIVTTTLTVTQSPDVTVTPLQTICEGETINLVANGSPSGGDYLWSPTSETTPSILVSPGIGTTNYSVNYTLNGCASNQATTSVIVNPNPLNTVSVSNNVLTADQSGATYQWIDCNTNLDISGETNQTYTPTANGIFAVEIDLNGCTMLSQCETISTISIHELSSSGIVILPNPVTDNILVKGIETSDSDFSIYSTDGKLVLQGKLDNSKLIQTIDLAPGTYSIRFDGKSPVRFVKM